MFYLTIGGIAMLIGAPPQNKTQWFRFAMGFVGFAAFGALVHFLYESRSRGIIFEQDTVIVFDPKTRTKFTQDELFQRYARQEVSSISLKNLVERQAIFLRITIGDVDFDLTTRADFDFVLHRLEQLGYPVQADPHQLSPEEVL